MAKPFTVERAGALSAGLDLVGLIMLIVSISDLYGNNFKQLGAWGYWILGIGAVVLLIGAIWTFTYHRNVRKFRKLMEEKSRAAFVKQMDDVEYLAWNLPMKYEQELGLKKRDFGLK
jgi:hypothetical protein